MSELNSYMHNFREFQGYWFSIQEKIEDLELGVLGDRLDSGNLEPHEFIGNDMAALGDPGWVIYEDIHEHGEAEVAHFLVEDAISEGEPKKAGVYWEKFQEADEALENAEDQIFSRLDEAGMEDKYVDHIRNQYEEHVEPLLDGSMFEE